MNWKEFLKPTAKKILLTIVIFIIFSFLPIVPANYGYWCPGCIYTEFHSLWSTLSYPLAMITPFTYLVIIAEIFLAYIISCWIISKFNKK
jgi:hypothetical protein